MHSSFIALGLTVLLVAGLVAVVVSQENDELCATAPAGNPPHWFVPSPNGCEFYILCQNLKATREAECPPNSWFNNDRQACMNPGTFCVQPACRDAASNTFVADESTGCGAWNYCVNGGINHSGVCPHSLSFIEGTQTCTYPFCGGDPAPAFETSGETPQVRM